MPSVYLTSNYTGIAALGELHPSSLHLLFSSQSCAVVILYDWIINLSREVEMFWSGDASMLSTALYFANRSVSLSIAALEAVGLGSWSDEVRAFNIET